VGCPGDSEKKRGGEGWVPSRSNYHTNIAYGLYPISLQDLRILSNVKGFTLNIVVWALQSVNLILVLGTKDCTKS
jgi:hypothetical protein